jgi:hypothetical protein
MPSGVGGRVFLGELLGREGLAEGVGAGGLGVEASVR